MRKVKKEKGRLWGTKWTFFRRKEIRVSLLTSLMQSVCHSSLLLFFLRKVNIDAAYTLLPFFPACPPGTIFCTSGIPLSTPGWHK